jgi:hypothetical protein
MGVPLNTPVERREFSRAYTKHWMALMNAHGKFMGAVVEYSESGRLGKYRLVKRRWNALNEAVETCAVFALKLGGNASPPVFKSQQDEHENLLLRFFLTKRAAPFVEYWAEVIDAAEAGAEVTIDPGDIPLWFDPE